MSSNLSTVLKSSVFRKQVSALTGLALVGFVVAHLAGNLLIFAGPEAFNAYAHKLAELGPLLWVMRIGLISAFLIHICVTIMLVLKNRKARHTRYDVVQSHGNRKFATQMMKYSGSMIAIFIIFHLIDFTFKDKVGDGTIVTIMNNGEVEMLSLGLYGLVWNSFKIWWHDLFYILAVASVGLHLTHAIQSVFQTFGVNHDKYTPIIKKISVVVGVLVAIAFSAIPIYVYFADKPLGV